MTAVYAPSAFKVYVAFGGGPMTESPTWTDISADFMSISTNRGRSSELDAFQAGTCTVVLNNRDRDYDPTYASSPYNGNIAPRRQIKVEVEADGGTYPIFRGVISSWRQTWAHDDGQYCTVDAVDFSSILSSTPVDAIDTVESVSERIVAVLGATDLPVGLLDAGTASSQVGPSEAGYAWEVASLAAGSELGRLFVGADGIVVYSPPTDDFGATAAAVFADDSTSGAIRYAGYELTIDDRWIVNACDVTGVGVSARSYDPTSVSTYGGSQRDHACLLVAETACGGLAATIVNRYKTPQVRGSSWMSTPTTEEELAALSGIELGTVVEVVRTPRVGTAHTATVQVSAIGVTADETGAVFTFTGSPVDTTDFFVWGTSLWGGSDGWR